MAEGKEGPPQIRIDSGKMSEIAAEMRRIANPGVKARELVSPAGLDPAEARTLRAGHMDSVDSRENNLGGDQTQTPMRARRDENSLPRMAGGADNLPEESPEMKVAERARRIRQFDQEHPDYEEWEAAVDAGEDRVAEEIEKRVGARIKLDTLLEPKTAEEEELEVIVQGQEGSPSSDIDWSTFTRRDSLAVIVAEVDSLGIANGVDKNKKILQAVDPNVDLSEFKDEKMLQERVGVVLAAQLNGALYSPRQVELIISQLRLGSEAEKKVWESIYKDWESQIEGYKETPESGHADQLLLSKLREKDEGFRNWIKQNEQKERPVEDYVVVQTERTPAQKGIDQLLDLLKEEDKMVYSLDELTTALLKIPDFSEKTRKKLAESPKNVITFLSLQMAGEKLDFENGEFWARIDPQLRALLLGENSTLRKVKPEFVKKAETSYKMYIFERDSAPKSREESEHDGQLLQTNLTLDGSRHSIDELRKDFENWAFSNHQSPDARLQALGTLSLSRDLLRSGYSNGEELFMLNIQNLRYRPAQITYLMGQSGLSSEAIQRIMNELYSNVEPLGHMPSYRSYADFLKRTEGYKIWASKPTKSAELNPSTAVQTKEMPTNDKNDPEYQERDKGKSFSARRIASAIFKGLGFGLGSKESVKKEASVKNEKKKEAEAANKPVAADAMIEPSEKQQPLEAGGMPRPMSQDEKDWYNEYSSNKGFLGARKQLSDWLKQVIEKRTQGADPDTAFREGMKNLSDEDIWGKDVVDLGYTPAQVEWILGQLSLNADHTLKLKRGIYSHVFRRTDPGWGTDEQSMRFSRIWEDNDDYMEWLARDASRERGSLVSPEDLRSQNTTKRANQCIDLINVYRERNPNAPLPSGIIKQVAAEIKRLGPDGSQAEFIAKLESEEAANELRELLTKFEAPAAANEWLILAGKLNDELNKVGDEVKPDPKKAAELAEGVVNSALEFVSKINDDRVDQKAFSILNNSKEVQVEAAVKIQEQIIEADSRDSILDIEKLVKTAKLLGLGRVPAVRSELDNVLRLYPEIEVDLTESGN